MVYYTSQLLQLGENYYSHFNDSIYLHSTHISFRCHKNTHTLLFIQRLSEIWLGSRQYLVNIDAVFLHVVLVIDLPPINKLHGQDPLCGQIPMDHGNL